MRKQIALSEEAHAKVQAWAEAGNRSIGRQANLIVEFFERFHEQQTIDPIIMRTPEALSSNKSPKLVTGWMPKDLSKSAQTRKGKEKEDKV